MMTTYAEALADYQELEEEISSFVQEVDEMMEDHAEDVYKILSTVKDDTVGMWNLEGKQETLDSMQSLGLVEENDGEYSNTLLGLSYLHGSQPVYTRSEGFDVSDPEALESGLWDLAVNGNVDARSVPSIARVAASELERVYDDLLRDNGETPRYPGLGEREEAVLNLELVRGVAEAGSPDPEGKDFIGVVNQGLNGKTGLYFGVTREEGSNVILPTQTGEIFRLERVDSGEELRVVRKKSGGGVPTAEPVTSVDREELEGWLEDVREGLEPENQV